MDFFVSILELLVVIEVVLENQRRLINVIVTLSLHLQVKGVYTIYQKLQLVQKPKLNLERIMKSIKLNYCKLRIPLRRVNCSGLQGSLENYSYGETYWDRHLLSPPRTFVSL